MLGPTTISRVENEVNYIIDWHIVISSQTNTWIGLEKPIWDELTSNLCGSIFHQAPFALVIVMGAPT